MNHQDATLDKWFVLHSLVKNWVLYFKEVHFMTLQTKIWLWEQYVYGMYKFDLEWIVKQEDVWSFLEWSDVAVRSYAISGPMFCPSVLQRQDHLLGRCVWIWLLSTCVSPTAGVFKFIDAW